MNQKSNSNPPSLAETLLARAAQQAGEKHNDPMMVRRGQRLERQNKVRAKQMISAPSSIKN